MPNPDVKQYIEDFDRRRREFLERRGAAQIQKDPEKEKALWEYWQQVYSVKPKSSGLPIKIISQEMSYDVARKKVWELFEKRANEIAAIEDKPDFEWQFDLERRKLVANLIRYFINDPACELKLNKGLFVYGPNGTGKTETMSIMAKFCEQEGLSKAFKCCSASKLYTDSKADKDFDPLKMAVQNNRMFDEFLRYTGPITRYGDTLDINEAVIEQRYDRYKSYGQLTHIISNTTPNDASTFLTKMAFDRMREMCQSVCFTGESKRR